MEDFFGSLGSFGSEKPVITALIKVGMQFPARYVTQSETRYMTGFDAKYQFASIAINDTRPLISYSLYLPLIINYSYLQSLLSIPS